MNAFQDAPADSAGPPPEKPAPVVPDPEKNKGVFSKLGLFLRDFELIVCSIMLCSIILLQFIQVVGRYGFGRSISWAEELSRFALLALVYISAAIGARYGTHIRISAQLRVLPRGGRILCAALAALIWITFNGYVIWYSVELIETMARRPLISGALMWDMRWIYAIIPFGFALQIIRILELWLTMWRTGNFTPVLKSGED